MIRSMIAGLLLLLALPVGASSLPCGDAATGQTPATYTAAGGERLDACFDQANDKVTLRRSGGETITLPSAISASGARYSDGSRTFWEHQGAGRYFSGEKLLFEGNLTAPAAYNTGVTSKVLSKTGVTSNGQKVAYPVTDKAEVTALLVDLAPGAETGWHKHPVPVYAFVLSGNLTIEMEGGNTLMFKAGDAIIEMVDTFHNGKNIGIEPVRLAVFYTGVQGLPNVIRMP